MMKELRYRIDPPNRQNSRIVMYLFDPKGNPVKVAHVKRSILKFSLVLKVGKNKEILKVVGTEVHPQKVREKITGFFGKQDWSNFASSTYGTIKVKASKEIH